MTSVVNLHPSPYFFLGGLKVTFIAALGTLLHMPTLYVALRHRVSSWPASSSQPRVAQCASALESVIYGTQHTTSGYPLNRKSMSCPRAYRAFLVTPQSQYLGEGEPVEEAREKEGNCTLLHVVSL